MSNKARNIVVCLDGTENTPTKNDTSVVRIYRAALEAGGVNIAYYGPGIGTSPRPGSFRFLMSKMNRKFGSASGHGMIEDVGHAYEFLNETYRDEDRLFFFGFSRGAYTARLLASVIRQIGLLRPGHRHLVPYALNLALAGREGEADAFSRKLDLHRRKPKVDFLGLFDCVKSAIFAVDAGWSPIRFRNVPFSWFNRDVLHVRHAIAIDEKRAFFPVNRGPRNTRGSCGPRNRSGGPRNTSVITKTKWTGKP